MLAEWDGQGSGHTDAADRRGGLTEAAKRNLALAAQLVASHQRVAEIVAELRDRARALSAPDKQTVAQARSAAPFQVGPVVVDPLRQSLAADGHSVTLTPTEWRMFAALLRAAGDVVSTTTLAEAVWDGAMVDRRAEIHVYASRLRAKLVRVDPDGHVRVSTIRGEGYRLAIDDRT